MSHFSKCKPLPKTFHVLSKRNKIVILDLWADPIPESCYTLRLWVGDIWGEVCDGVWVPWLLLLWLLLELWLQLCWWLKRRVHVHGYSIALLLLLRHLRKDIASHVRVALRPRSGIVIWWSLLIESRCRRSGLGYMHRYIRVCLRVLLRWRRMIGVFAVCVLLWKRSKATLYSSGVVRVVCCFKWRRIVVISNWCLGFLGTYVSNYPLARQFLITR